MKQVIRTIRWIKSQLLIISIAAVIYFWGTWASLGLVFGYLVSRYVSGPAEKTRGSVPSLRFSLGRYKLHFHHWLLTLSCLILLRSLDVFGSNSFLFWVCGGNILQGVLCYNDWYKIIYRG